MEGDELNLTGATKLASVSTTTVRRWLQSGELEGHKNNGAWVIDRQSLMLHLQKIGASRKGYSNPTKIQPPPSVGEVEVLKDSLRREREEVRKLHDKVAQLEDELKASNAELKALLKAQNMTTFDRMAETVKNLSKWRKSNHSKVVF